MRECDVPAVNMMKCPGHLAKFDNCLVEALYEMALESAEASGGGHDFEGTVDLVIVTSIENWTLAHSGRVVAIEPGVYLVFVAESGQVTLATISDADAGREIVEACAARHAAWERGCDPDKISAHLSCEGEDQCALSASALADQRG